MGAFRLAVRGGNTFSVEVTIQQSSGTDIFTDAFGITYTTSYTVTVGCDEIVVVKFIVPPNPIGTGGGGIVGKIVGNVGMSGEFLHWFDKTHFQVARTLMMAEDGPQGNARWDVVTPSSIGGPSSGAFDLKNLLPSNFSTPPRDYNVQAGFYMDGHK